MKRYKSGLLIAALIICVLMMAGCGEDDTPNSHTTGDEITDATETGPSHIHIFSEWEMIGQPSCIETALEERSCVCGEKETRVVSMLGHNVVNGKCERCGKTSSQGLQYTLNDNNSWSVTGIGTCTDSDIMIPAEHEGKSVSCISWRSFSGHPDLTYITIGDNVTHIDDWAFSECSGLTGVAISDSVITIGEGAFCGCEKLVHITMGNGVTNIGASAFCSCSHLPDITISDSVIDIGTSAFQGCSDLTNVVIGDGVTDIGVCAFKDCTSLADVTIGHSVIKIGRAAFEGCEGLKNLHITDMAAWCNISLESNPWSCVHDIYLNEKPVTSLIIPEGVINIGDYAFYGCSSLTSVTVPDGVTGLGSSSFQNCAKLTSVTIGNGVTEIGWGAFSDCAKLTSVTIGNSVTGIGWRAFYNCIGLTDITIGDSVTNIGGYAFSGCQKLSEVDLPDHVIRIGQYAFSGCESLTNITIPDSVISIGMYTFAGCSNLTTMTIPFVGATAGGKENTHFGYIFGAVSYENNKVVLPANLNSVVVTGGERIVDRAFYDCTGLTSITLPNSVTSIGIWAFYNCESLTSITIPDGVTSVDSRAFYGCSSLTSITIPDSVTGIGSSAFLNTAYYNDDSNWTDGVLYIGHALIDCKEDTTGAVTIKDGTTCIADYAFYKCSGLTSITIPDGVTGIGGSAFGGCESLTSITFTGTKEQWHTMEKGEDWKAGTGSFTVHCTDGDIAWADA